MAAWRTGRFKIKKNGQDIPGRRNHVNKTQQGAGARWAQVCHSEMTHLEWLKYLFPLSLWYYIVVQYCQDFMPLQQNIRPEMCFSEFITLKACQQNECHSWCSNLLNKLILFKVKGKEIISSALNQEATKILIIHVICSLLEIRMLKIILNLCILYLGMIFHLIPHQNLWIWGKTENAKNCKS